MERKEGKEKRGKEEGRERREVVECRRRGEEHASPFFFSALSNTNIEQAVIKLVYEVGYVNALKSGNAARRNSFRTKDEKCLVQ
jgi:hypothetical protein